MELIPCPHCNQKPKESPSHVALCTTCNYSLPVQIWQSRPIEDSLRRQLAEAQDEIAGLKADEKSAKSSKTLTLIQGMVNCLRKWSAWTHITPISAYPMDLRDLIENCLANYRAWIDDPADQPHVVNIVNPPKPWTPGNICLHCNGSGKYYEKQCPYCNGYGHDGSCENVR